MKKLISFLLCTLIACIFIIPVSAEALKGVDVYHGDGSINWQEVAETKQFAYVKASQANHFTDCLFKENITGIKQTTMKWGAYHFMEFGSVESAKNQARRFYNIIKGTGYSLKPALDVETADGIQSAAEIRKEIVAFCNEFERLSGVDPVLYTYTAYYGEYSLEKLNMSVIWQADYRKSRGDIGLAPSIWQYSESGKCPGITAKKVDLNEMYDDKAFLNSSDFKTDFSESTKASTVTSENISFNPSVNSRAGKQFQVLNAQGTPQHGHSVFVGDKLKIIGVDYARQIAEIMYPVSDYWVHGYIKNDERFLHNSGYNSWHNGSTNETVYNAAGERAGTIFPYERATILGKADNGDTAVLYATKRGTETKSGFVKFGGVKR